MACASPYAWQADVDTTVVIPALSLLYLFAVGRFGAPRWRIACFAVAMALLAVAFWTPLHHLGLHYLLTAHLLQNVILAEWAPLLRCSASRRAMADALARHARVAPRSTHPAVALPLWLANYFAWHVPPVYDAALEHQAWLIHLEHACYFGDRHPGVVAARAGRAAPARVRRARGLRVRGVRARRRRSACCSRCCPRPVYDFYVDVRDAHLGASPLADQEIAGVTMASEQAIVLFVVFLYWFRRFLAEEGAI